MTFYMQLLLSPRITTEIRFLQQADGEYSLHFDIRSFSILTCLISVFTERLQNASFCKGYKRHNWHDICLASGSGSCSGLRRANHEVRVWSSLIDQLCPKGLMMPLSFCLTLSTQGWCWETDPHWHRVKKLWLVRVSWLTRWISNVFAHKSILGK